MKKIECTCCQKRVPASKAQSYNWGSYCPSCVEQYMYRCSICGELEDRNFSEDHATDLCENCWNEEQFSQRS